MDSIIIPLVLILFALATSASSHTWTVYTRTSIISQRLAFNTSSHVQIGIFNQITNHLTREFHHPSPHSPFTTLCLPLPSSLLLLVIFNSLLRRPLTTIRRPIKEPTGNVFMVPFPAEFTFPRAYSSVVRSVCAFAAPCCGCFAVEEVFEPGEHFMVWGMEAAMP